MTKIVNIRGSGVRS